MEAISTVDFLSHGLKLTSARSTTKEAIKRKLTARVSPMTRPTDQGYNPSVDAKVSNVNISHGPSSNCIVKKKDGSGGFSNCTATASSCSRKQKKPAEKRKAPATNVIIAPESLKSNPSHSNLKAKGEPSAKRLRTILPRTTTTTSLSQGIPQVSNQATPRSPISPEPKLRSLLSASECHLAALQDEDGDTPLHIAIAHGNTKLTEYLISLMSFMTLDIYNNLKQTPLHLAVITGQTEIVGKLVSAGASSNVPDRNGHTPCHLACQRSYVNCLEKLVMESKEVNLELKNYNGFTPLHEAVLASCTRSVKCLVENGANINSKDGKSGRTPLHHAVETENTDIIAELLKYGANPSEPSFSGNTPIQIASGRGMQTIRQILENTAKGIPVEDKQMCSKQPQPDMLTSGYENFPDLVEGAFSFTNALN